MTQCAICKKECEERSSCSNRYHGIQGQWDYNCEGDLPDYIAVCDVCFEENHVEEKDNIIIGGDTFWIDSYYRENE